MAIVGLILNAESIKNYAMKIFILPLQVIVFHPILTPVAGFSPKHSLWKLYTSVQKHIPWQKQVAWAMW
jgi:hypothetical protein